MSTPGMACASVPRPVPISSPQNAIRKMCIRDCSAEVLATTLDVPNEVRTLPGTIRGKAGQTSSVSLGCFGCAIKSQIQATW